MATYKQGDRGPAVTRLEIALKELDLYRASMDDIYGDRLADAVRTYQEQHGLPVTGAADEQTARMILAEPSPLAAVMTGKPPEYRSLSLTAGFETSRMAPECFSGLAGDFDGQGISFGVLQWNLGQGTLQQLLTRLDEEHTGVLDGAFGSGAADLRDILRKDKASQLNWARQIQTGNRRSLAEPWRSRFKALGQTAECQDAQVRAAENLFARAKRLCDEYGLWSQRAAALMFDIVVQNGSIRDRTRTQILREFPQAEAGLDVIGKEIARMKVIANRRAEDSRPQYVEDVRRRKLTIATGVGVVHGRGYDLSRQYLIEVAPMEGVTVPAPPIPR